MTTHLVPCPSCDADIDSDATICHHCGGEIDVWHDEYDDQSDFDYEEFIADEFPDQVSGRYTNTHTKAIWRLVAVILLVLFLLASIS